MSIAVPLSPSDSNLGSSAGFDLWNYLFVCALVLGLLIGSAYFLRRFVAGNVRRRAAKRALRVVDALPLNGRVKLVVVSCYDRNFLLGLGDKDVRSIAELDTEEAHELVRPSIPPRSEAPEPFGAALARAARGGGVIDLAPRTRGPASVPWKEGQGVLG